MPYYTGNSSNWRDTPSDLPAPITLSMNSPEKYQATPELITAVNVALVLGQPLLLTGDPGVGKTHLAYNVAMELGLGNIKDQRHFGVLRFDVKSTTEARDLFYTFDAVRHFRDSRSKNAELQVRNYLVLQALGTATLLTLPASSPFVKRYWDEDRNGQFTGPKRSVVLIDEIDKAPRDVPNDLLNELELGYFHLFEDGNRRVQSQQQYRPVVILTSNSEKHLPDAFLRRCVYHHIAMPPPEKLKQIVESRLKETSEVRQILEDEAVDDVLQLFHMLRDPNRGIYRTPGTAEVLAALATLQRMDQAVGTSLKKALQQDSLKQYAETALEGVLRVLVKDKDDLKHAESIASEWRNKETLPAGKVAD